jgi:hypothetical protein
MSQSGRGSDRVVCSSHSRRGVHGAVSPLPFSGAEKSYLHVCRLEYDRCAKDTLDTIKALWRCSDQGQGQDVLDAFGCVHH